MTSGHSTSRALGRFFALGLSIALSSCAPASSPDSPDLRDGPCLLGASVERLEAPTLEETATLSEANLRAWIEALTAPELRGRRAGLGPSGEPTGDAARVAELLGRYLTSPPPAGLGLDPAFADGPCQAFDAQGAREANVLVFLPADLKTERPLDADPPPLVVLAAHYDGQGLHPTRGPLPGADDNASGVAAILEATRLLARQPNRRADVLVALLGAEEIGLLGSARLAEDPPFGRLPALALVLDMVGRPLPIPEASDHLAVRAGDAPGDASALRELAERIAETSGVSIVDLSALVPIEAAPGRSDDRVFDEAGWPALLLTTGVHADYHGPGDLAARVEIEQVARAARFVLSAAALFDIEVGDAAQSDTTGRMRAP